MLLYALMILSSRSRVDVVVSNCVASALHAGLSAEHAPASHMEIAYPCSRTVGLALLVRGMAPSCASSCLCTSVDVI